MVQFDTVWLLILFICWAVLLFGGLLGKPDAERTRRMPRWMRMASSFVLVVAAWSFALFHRQSNSADVAVLVAVGMTLGFVGDLFMARLILRDNRHIFGGIGSFGLGHIAYIAALLMLADRHAVDNAGLRWGALIVVLLIGVAAWYGVVYRPSHERGTLHLAALPYALLLSTTAGVAVGLALIDGRYLPVAVGAVLFLTSDLILAARLFNKLYFRWIDDWVWLTYGPAQMLIVFGMGMMLLGT